jgi:hypothetical protein
MYKRTLTAAFKKETRILLIALYIKLTALQHATIIRNYSIKVKIAKILDKV